MRKPSSKTLFNRSPRLTRHTTYRLSAEIAHELDVHAAVRRLDLGGVTSQRAIVEKALGDWFRKNPIPKELRAAAELLMTRQGDGS